MLMQSEAFYTAAFLCFTAIFMPNGLILMYIFIKKYLTKR